MKLNYKKTIFVGFAFFLICAFWQAYDSIVPMMLVNKFGLNQTFSGFIMALDNVLAVVLLPVFGAISDKTKTRFGRRTPYIVIGTIISICAFIGMTFADNTQLNKVLENKEPTEFAMTLWEENVEVKSAETSKNITIQNYTSNLVYNKDFESLTTTEKQEVKEFFKKLSTEYEITYSYENGVYEIVENEKNNAYTNLFVSARSSYAWQTTKNNKLPLILFACVLLVTLISMSIFRSPAVALMPDVTVKPLRSKANAIINLMGTAGGVLVLLLGLVFKTGKTFNQMMSYTPFVLAVSGIMAFGLVLFILKVREVKWAKEMEEESKLIETEEEKELKQEITTTGKLDKKRLLSLILILCSVALWYMGYNAVTSKYSLYATNVLHKDFNTTLLVAQATAIISYIPVGLLASKFGRKKAILVGVLILFTAFLLAIFVSSSTPSIVMYLVFGLAGIGWATINVNSFPMVVELATGSDIGKYTGYYYTASMTAQILTPILSGALMDAFSKMTVLFPYATIFVGLSFVTMLFVKYGDNKVEAKKSILENFDIDD